MFYPTLCQHRVLCLSLHPNKCVTGGVHLQETSQSLHLVIKGRTRKHDWLCCFWCCLCRALLLGDASGMSQYVTPWCFCHWQLSGLPTGGSQKPCSDPETEQSLSHTHMASYGHSHLCLWLDHSSWETKASFVQRLAWNMEKRLLSLILSALERHLKFQNPSTINKGKQGPF